MGFAAVLSDRAAIRLTGPDAPHFLHNLVTSSVETLATGEAAYSALLTPQGKIIADFMVLRTPDGFLLDVPVVQRDELKKRLTLYKLRADIAILLEELLIVAFWDTPSPPVSGAFPDPRFPELGYRAFVPTSEIDHVFTSATTKASEADYHAHRIALGIPEGGRDFMFGDTFPHEADMDQLGGVDFRKGCYIGQEVVSRTHHRTTARTRAVPVRIDGAAQPGDIVLAGDKTVGNIGSLIDTRGIAMLRIDRADDALAAGIPLTAGDAVVTIAKPSWAHFRFPGEPLPEPKS